MTFTSFFLALLKIIDRFSKSQFQSLKMINNSFRKYKKYYHKLKIGNKLLSMTSINELKINYAFRVCANLFPRFLVKSNSSSKEILLVCEW